MKNSASIARALDKVLELHRERNLTMDQFITCTLIAMQLVMKGEGIIYVTYILESMIGLEIKRPGRKPRHPEMPPPQLQPLLPEPKPGVVVEFAPKPAPEPIVIYIPAGDYTVGQYAKNPASMYKTDRDQVAIIRAMYNKLLDRHMQIDDAIEYRRWEGSDFGDLLLQKFDIMDEIRSLDLRAHKMCTEYAK